MVAIILFLWKNLTLVDFGVQQGCFNYQNPKRSIHKSGPQISLCYQKYCTLSGLFKGAIFPKCLILLHSTWLKSPRKSVVVSTLTPTWPTTNNTTNDGSNKAKVRIPPIIIMKQEATILDIISAHIDNLPNKFIINKDVSALKYSSTQSKSSSRQKPYLSSTNRNFL